MIKVKNLNFCYKNKKVLNDLSFDIKENTITTIIGPNGSGKSTLAKILVGLLKYDGIIEIDNKLLNKNIKELRKEIGIVFENPDNQFVAETVYYDIAFTLENMNYKGNIKKKIMDIARYLNIDNILNSEPNSLSSGKKQLVALASALVHDPKILILDEALTYIDGIEKDKVYQLLKELKDKGMTIINITHDVEETYLSDNIISIDKGIIKFNGKKEDYYKLNSINLPFMVELSNKLMFYDLIDRVYYDMEELVGVLWK